MGPTCRSIQDVRRLAELFGLSLTSWSEELRFAGHCRATNF
jgi:hypothetical protein